MENPNLIVMLTHNDKTVDNAYEVFEKCKNTQCQFFGMKEEDLPPYLLKKVFKYMKDCGKTTVLEVVAYSDFESMRGAFLAKYCGCDILMGTIYSDSINDFCKKNNIIYIPFVGDIKERPSILSGSIESMVDEANLYCEKGVFGIDLLGYRYTGDAFELNKKMVQETNGKVCIAGSVNSIQRLDEIKEISPWAFTIGGAFFENKFGDSISEQIDKVYTYVRR